MPYKILLVDDERLIRSDLRQMLADYEDICIVGESGSVDAAVEILPTVSIDAVFLDIQMPRKSGFELLPHLPPNIRVVFVTAFDEYAVRAFEVNSLDYLLKPVSPERLAVTLERLRTMPKKSPSPVQTQPELSYTDRLFVNAGRHGMFIALAEVRCIRAAGVYSEIVLSDNEAYLDNCSLQMWEKRLPKEFLRIHRAVIANTRHIERTITHLRDKCSIVLNNLQAPLSISRRSLKQWREYWNQPPK